MPETITLKVILILFVIVVVVLIASGFLIYVVCRPKPKKVKDTPWFRVSQYTNSPLYQDSTFMEICMDLNLLRDKEREEVFIELNKLIEEKVLEKNRDTHGRLVYTRTSPNHDSE
jgi:hypothetical protein